MRKQGENRMNFFTSIIEKVKEKKAELDDRKDYLKMVDEQVKPIRRKAYMQQMFKESVNEGIAMAMVDSKKRLPKEKKSPEDFGIKKEENQWAFLDSIGKDKDKTLTKSGKKK